MWGTATWLALATLLGAGWIGLGHCALAPSPAIKMSPKPSPTAVPSPIPPAAPKQYDIRLVGGRFPSEGRVEMFDGQEWGTICSLQRAMDKTHARGSQESARSREMFGDGTSW
ncbi:hypothetical protein VOLCADRAFT_92581 [Volvox carteri f. nagariensis]|uniref:SRCR domain-containing protein n=1 Tax=Volvox carteri f. nagariensis TaxID=3068 RepID=D8U012_VOLCA|nr:uncharacterized protein VOLCADRAFT_92581 [Volvox carteri f. nagariensis]EFJ46856.1 hypothetical protein VOLCADRAFT_92581 [Volvox carteri f. nagariensis]|eukprot:XP_002952065.1 hypothetical protein VOLCADRAFT_92581 [Volvox carteri f. nagariensis]